MPTGMDKDAIDKKALKKRLENSPDAVLEAALKQPRAVSNVAEEIVTKRQRKLRRSNCVTAYATAVTAVATSIAAVLVCLQYCQSVMRPTSPVNRLHPSRLRLHRRPKDHGE
jgi:hypothetical protein